MKVPVFGARGGAAFDTLRFTAIATRGPAPACATHRAEATAGANIAPSLETAGHARDDRGGGRAGSAGTMSPTMIDPTNRFHCRKGPDPLRPGATPAHACEPDAHGELVRHGIERAHGGMESAL